MKREERLFNSVTSNWSYRPGLGGLGYLAGFGFICPSSPSSSLPNFDFSLSNPLIPPIFSSSGGGFETDYCRSPVSSGSLGLPLGGYSPTLSAFIIVPALNTQYFLFSSH